MSSNKRNEIFEKKDILFSSPNKTTMIIFLSLLEQAYSKETDLLASFFSSSAVAQSLSVLEYPGHLSLGIIIHRIAKLFLVDSIGKYLGSFKCYVESKLIDLVLLSDISLTEQMGPLLFSEGSWS
jgi:hypothetical protein